MDGLERKRKYLKNKWFGIRSRCTGKGKTHHSYHGLPYCEKERFIKWAIERRDFHATWERWESLNFTQMECPSIDRIDPKKGYVFGNMRFIPYRKNKRKKRLYCDRGHYIGDATRCKPCNSIHNRMKYRCGKPVLKKRRPIIHVESAIHSPCCSTTLGITYECRKTKGGTQNDNE